MPEASDRVDGRKLRYRGRREELLRGVTAYVLEHGVGDLAIRRVAEAVGVSHATLLNHFGTKENLVTEVIDGLRRRSVPIDPDGPLPDGIGDDGAALLAAWWAQWTKPEHLPALRITFEVYAQALIHPERYERFLDEVVGGWLRLLGRIVEASGAPADEVEPVATILLGLMRGLHMDLLATGEQARVDAALALALEIVGERQARWRAAPAV